MGRAWRPSVALAIAATGSWAQGLANDPLLGERIATQGGGNAVTACAICHGSRGEGRTDVGAPPLAGLSAAYLRMQLDRYANGTRTDAVMPSIAKAMSRAQRDAVAGYYAGLPDATAKPPRSEK